MNLTGWAHLSVATEGEPLEIDGVDVWCQDWQRLDIGTLEVPHPSDHHQRHTLHPYVIESDGNAVVFCAGELSNGVWCFYVPAGGQPNRECKGMTVVERLYETSLLEDFDLAIDTRNRRRAKDILLAAGLISRQATETVERVLENPEKYGYEKHENKHT